jgi:aquaporin Z
MATLSRRRTSEGFGTFWLVFGGCGSAVLAASFPSLGIGFAGVALAFGLTVLTMVFALGHISGGHPAVTFGLWSGGRFPAKDIAPYVVVQVAGAIIAAFVLMTIAQGSPDFVMGPHSLAVNGYGEMSPGKYSLQSALLIEIVLSFGFLIVILGAADSRASAGFAPIAIGLALTLIHLISIPVTNTSVNPARSTGPALLVGGLALQQLWLFWVAPIAGGWRIAGWGRRARTSDAAPQAYWLRCALKVPKAAVARIPLPESLRRPYIVPTGIFRRPCGRRPVALGTRLAGASLPRRIGGSRPLSPRPVRHSEASERRAVFVVIASGCGWVR